MPKSKGRCGKSGEAMRDLGIKVLGKAPWGSHLCQFYQTKKDLIDVLVPYFKAGLQSNEFCMWVTAEPLSAQEAEKALERKVKDLDHYIKKGQIEILDYKNWYTKSGKFDSDKVLQGWVRKEKEAIKKGFDGIRLTGNTFWLKDKDWKEFTEYESTVNDVMGSHRMIALCSYSIDKCSAVEVIDVFGVHQSALIKRDGKWTVVVSQEKFEENESLLEEILNGVQEGIVMVDEDETITFCNPAFGVIFDEGIADLIGKNLSEFMDDENRSLMLQQTEKRKKGKKSTYEIQVVTAKGDRKWLRISATPRFGKDGSYIGAFGPVLDITDQKRMEEELRESEEILRATIASTADGILAVDGDGMVIHANERFLQLWRIPQNMLANKDDSRLFDFVLKQLEEPDAFIEKIQELYNSLEESFDTIKFLDGRVFEGVSYPLLKGEENRGRVWSFRDVTESIKVKRMKDEFISTVSHELRTPLTSIHGALSLVTQGKAGKLPPEARKLLTIAERNSTRLQNLIDDMLDIQKIESGKVEFHFRPLDLQPILEKSLEEMKSFGDQFNVEFILDDIIPGAKVNADCDRLMQVMDNLLSNAAKFSPPNSPVKVSVSRRDKMVRVAIKDHGSGIPVEFQDKLFKKFTQADPSHQRVQGGTGLGLNIVKSIIDRHEGKVDFETGLEMGTTFYFELPEWKDEKDESKKAK
jgi:PAS domain S-box-containing protein